MTPEQATRVARKLAGWSITGTIIDKSVRVHKKVATEWHQLVGAQTVEEVTPRALHADVRRYRPGPAPDPVRP